jgi:hypothetical protein
MESKVLNLDNFVIRLKKIGFQVKLAGNYPWVYLDEVNGMRVEEVFYSEHYFCIGFMQMKLGTFRFNDFSEIFKVIRKYKKATNN